SIPPFPSHWFFWQSPIVCAFTAVPCAAKVIPQVPALQVRVAHSVSVPEHWEGLVHSAQLPEPSQNDVPLGPQGASLALAGFEGTPPVQTSSVHALLSTGTSVSSGCMATTPALQTACWQSPMTWVLARVPSAFGASAHLPPASQTAST